MSCLRSEAGRVKAMEVQVRDYRAPTGAAVADCHWRTGTKFGEQWFREGAELLPYMAVPSYPSTAKDQHEEAEYYWLQRLEDPRPLAAEDLHTGLEGPVNHGDAGINEGGRELLDGLMAKPGYVKTNLLRQYWQSATAFDQYLKDIIPLKEGMRSQ